MRRDTVVSRTYSGPWVGPPVYRALGRTCPLKRSRFRNRHANVRFSSQSRTGSFTVPLSVPGTCGNDASARWPNVAAGGCSGESEGKRIGGQGSTCMGGERKLETRRVLTVSL